MSRLIDLKEVLRRIPVKRQTIDNWKNAGKFPQRVKVEGRIFWLEAEIDEWILERAGERPPRPPLSEISASEELEPAE